MCVTVLMPVYNGSEYIAGAIESILGQTMGDFEFLMLDDGSTDGSLDIMLEYQKLDQRIRVVTKENTGITNTLRYGVNVARGKWIARQDVDDISALDRLGKQLEFVKSHREIRLVGSGMKVIDQDGGFVGEYTYPMIQETLIEGVLKSGKIFPHTSAFIERSAALDIGNYRERIKRSQDIDLWLRMSERYRIGCLEEALVRVRMHDKQVSKGEGGLEMMTYQKIVLASRYERVQRGTDFVDDINDDEAFMRLVSKARDLVKCSGVLDWLRIAVVLRSVVNGRLVSRGVALRSVNIKSLAGAIAYRLDRNRAARRILSISEKREEL